MRTKLTIWLLSVAILWNGLGLTPHAVARQANQAVSATPGASQLSIEQQKQTSALAAHLILRDHFVDTFLKKVQFSPPGGAAGAWKYYPDYRKVLVAARMAEAAAPTKGADQLLAMLAYELANRGDPIRHEPTLAQITKSAFYHPAHAITFDASPLSSESPKLSPEQARAIKSIAKFLETGILGTPQAIMVRYADLSFDEAFRLLETSPSTEVALQSAIGTLPEHRRSVALSAMANDAAKVNSALRYEISLAALFRPNQGNDPGDFGPGPGFRPSGGGGGPGGGGVGGGRVGGAGGSGTGPVSTSEVEAAFKELEREAYPTAKSMEYDQMKANDGGFGGIVFGNKVNRTPGLAPVSRLAFVPNGQAYGRLVAVFSDGREATLYNVSFEEAWAAHRLIFTSVAGLPKWSYPQGIGLTGLDYECRNGLSPDTDHLFTPTQDRERVILNPALKDSNVGWSAIATDIRARYPEVLAQGIATEMRREGFDVDQSSGMARFVQRTFSGVPEVGWKVMDVPLEMSVEKGSLVFTRIDSVEQFPLGLRRSVYLQMFPKKASLLDTFPDQFYRLMPLLSKAFPEYRQMNHFAEVLALVRLARTDGAQYVEPTGVRKSTVTPEYILYRLGKISADPDPFCRGFSKESLQDAVDKLLNEPKQ